MIYAKEFDKKALRSKYIENLPKYRKLVESLKGDLDSILKDAHIDVLEVAYRIKKFDSFWEKIQRKGYKDPFQEMEDVCGLRIVCYYRSDVPEVSQILKNKFEVLELEDKTRSLEIDRFGYRSLHFILTIREKRLKTPRYRALDGLKAEVQVRTVLMHAWAGIEHKLAYKKKEHIPERFRRKLYQLSALLELADEQFDSLRIEREEYVKQLITEEVRKRGRFDIDKEMNLDSLQAFLDFYFADRSGWIRETSELLDEIAKFDITFENLVECFEEVASVLPAMEAAFFRDTEWAERRFRQVGIARTMLLLTRDDYWQYYQDNLFHHKLFLKRWRAKIRGRAPRRARQ